MSGAPAGERRKHDRRGKKFLVKFRVTGGGMPADFHDRVGQVLDLSRSGTLFRAKPELPIGTVLELNFPENIFGGGPITLHGAVRRLGAHSESGERPLGPTRRFNAKVVWTRAAEKQGQHRLGLKELR